MIKVRIEADIPSDLVETFLKVVRVFDKGFAGCHFKISVTGGPMTVEQAKALCEELGLPIIYAERML